MSNEWASCRLVPGCVQGAEHAGPCAVIDPSVRIADALEAAFPAAAEFPRGPWRIGKPAGRRGYNLYSADDTDVTNPDAQLDAQSAAMLQEMEARMRRAVLALAEIRNATILWKREEAAELLRRIHAIAAEALGE